MVSKPKTHCSERHRSTDPSGPPACFKHAGPLLHGRFPKQPRGPCLCHELCYSGCFSALN